MADQTKEINQATLGNLGFQAFSSTETNNLLAKLIRELEIGLNREDQPTTKDGGLMAIPNPIQVPGQDELKKIPPGTKVLAAALAGTNWKLVQAEFTDQRSPMRITELSGKRIPQNRRQFVSPQEFADFIADFIVEGMQGPHAGLLPILAIAFGFPQINLALSHGLDAQLPRDQLSKFWTVTQGKGMLVGKETLNALSNKGLKTFKQVVVANDTIAVVLDQTATFSQDQLVKPLPVGFVFGTGSNASLQWQDKLFNLEIGLATSIGYDPILKKMEELEQTSSTVPWFEHYTGGAFMIKRLAAGLILAQEKGILKNRIGENLLTDKHDSALLSQLSEDKLSYAQFQHQIGPVNQAELNQIKACARSVLFKGAQAAAVMVGAVAKTAGWSEGTVLVEGAVFWQAKLSEKISFKDQVLKTLTDLLGQHGLIFIPSSGVRGIATYAMGKSK